MVGEYDHILAAKLECLVHDLLNGIYHVDLTIALPGPHVRQLASIPQSLARPIHVALLPWLAG